MPLSEQRLALDPHWCEDCQADHALDLAERDRLRDEVERLRAQVADLEPWAIPEEMRYRLIDAVLERAASSDEVHDA